MPRTQLTSPRPLVGRGLAAEVGKRLFHFDANDLTPVADGTPVDQWNDLSGNGFNITATGTDRPTFYLNPFTGFGCQSLYFTGTNNLTYPGLIDFPQQKFMDMTADGGLTFVYVGAPRANANGAGLICQIGNVDTSTNPLLGFGPNLSTQINNASQNIFDLTMPNHDGTQSYECQSTLQFPDVATPRVLVVTYKKTPNIDFWLNGEKDTSNVIVNVGNNGVMDAPTGPVPLKLSVGCFYIDSSPSYTYDYMGHMFELICYEGVLDDQSIVDLSNEMIAKWNISL